MSKRKTHEEFMVEFSLRGNKNVIILGRYVNAITKILVKCKIDGYEWYANPQDLLIGHGCPVCRGLVVISGINDLATLRPDLIKYFENPEDATKFTVHSNKSAHLRCPDCGTKKTMVINMLDRRGFNCTACGDGISFPNKLGRSLLRQLPVDYCKHEWSPGWLKPYSYDNYFIYCGKNYVLEMDGDVGHGNKQWRSRKQDTNGIKRDEYKDILAKNHDVYVIRIDCRESDSNYIICNILNSELSSLFDLSNVDWEKCEKDAVKNVVKQICDEYVFNPTSSIIDIANLYGLSRCSVTKYLKIGAKFGWCDYSESKSIENKNARMSHMVSVFNLDMGLQYTYSSVKECSHRLSQQYNVVFSDTCIGRAAKSGKPYKNLYFQYT